MNDGVEWYLQFERRPEIGQLPLVDRRPALVEHFRSCLQRLSGFSRNAEIKILKENPLMLSATIVGPPDACEQLANYLVAEHLGMMVQNTRLAIAATASE